MNEATIVEEDDESVLQLCLDEEDAEKARRESLIPQ